MISVCDGTLLDSVKPKVSFAQLAESAFADAGQTRPDLVVWCLKHSILSNFAIGLGPSEMRGR